MYPLVEFPINTWPILFIPFDVITITAPNEDKQFHLERQNIIATETSKKLFVQIREYYRFTLNYFQTLPVIQLTFHQMYLQKVYIDKKLFGNISLNIVENFVYFCSL